MSRIVLSSEPRPQQPDPSCSLLLLSFIASSTPQAITADASKFPQRGVGQGGRGGGCIYIVYVVGCYDPPLKIVMCFAIHHVEPPGVLGADDWAREPARIEQTSKHASMCTVSAQMQLVTAHKAATSAALKPMSRWPWLASLSTAMGAMHNTTYAHQAMLAEHCNLALNTCKLHAGSPHQVPCS